MTTDRPLLGMALMAGFCLLAPLGDALAKILGDSIPVGQLVAVRFAVQAAVLLPIALLGGISLRLSRHAFRLTLLRTALHIAGIGTMFLALRSLPLAEAIAIAFVMPFLMLLLGKIVLQEDVGPRRMIACAVGFCGTLLVIQPTFASVGWPATLPLLVAVIFALFMLTTRQIAKEADPIALQAISGGLASAVLVPVLLVGQGTGLAAIDPVLPCAGDWGLLLALGLLGTGAHLLMTWSLRFAPSATLAPMQYLEIPFATLIGWILFGHLPNALAAVGIAITILAGLYVIARERRPRPAPGLA